MTQSLVRKDLQSENLILFSSFTFLIYPLKICPNS